MRYMPIAGEVVTQKYKYRYHLEKCCFGIIS